MEKSVVNVLRGNLERLPPLNSRLVRIFISSTFTDTILERNILMEDVYPKIKDFCKRRYGLDFQIVDMRWGVRREAMDDHSTSQLCLQEIFNCQKLSTGPNFVIFLGQKHGFCPLQCTIAEEEFQKLRSVLLKHDHDTSLVDQWYQRDDNSVPPVMVLQPISSLLSEDQNKAGKWKEISINLKNSLKFASQECFENGLIDGDTKHKYFMSVTEEEVIHGILKSDSDPSRSCLCFIRIIEDLDNNLSDNIAWRFIDMNNSVIDTEAQQLLQTLRDEKVAKTVKEKNIHKVRWSSGEGIGKEKHQEYLSAFCEQFYCGVTSMIDKAMKEENFAMANDLVVEVLQHALMATSRCDVFHGREDIMTKVQEHVTSSSASPLVIYGDSGCGKTSVMAKVASLIPKWFDPGRTPVVVLRFLGTSPRSSTIRKVLFSICRQIAANYQQDLSSEVPWELNELLTFFNKQLERIPKSKPLVLILDSLDQLSAENFAHKLNWLPKDLPSQVTVIVSTLPQHFDILKRLQDVLSDKCFLHVPSLGEDLSLQVLQSWLTAKGKSLTQEQLALVQTACEKCSLPLYVKLLYEKVILWRSYTKDPNELALHYTLQESIKSLFERLEGKHGELLVRHSLSYLTASQNGLSEVELEDLLSLDDDVLNDVYQYHVPPIRRIPPLIWVRIRHDIAAYLVDKEADETRVSFWYHRQFIEAARERYLHDNSFAQKIHSAIAEYFTGLWHGVAKPFSYNKAQQEKLGLLESGSSADRKVAAQPLTFSNDGGNEKRYNKRKLNQLPYHLAMAGRDEDLKHMCLFSYQWLHTKLVSTSIQQVLDDFKPLEKDSEVALLQKALSMSQVTLNTLPSSLALEISGRLLPYIATDKFNTKSSCLYALLRECFDQGPGQLHLVPRQQCFTSPGGPMKYQFEHPQIPVGTTNVALSPDSQHLFTLTNTNELLMWDLDTGEIEKQQQLLPLSEGKLNVMKLMLDQKNLVVGSVFQKETNTNPLVIIDSVTGDVVESLKLDTISLPLGFTDSLNFGVTKDKVLQIITAQYVCCFARNTGLLLKQIPLKCNESFVFSDRQCAIFHIQQSNVYEMYNLDTLEKRGEVVCKNTPLRLCTSKLAHQAFIAFKNSSSVQVVNLDPKDGDIGKTVLMIDHGKHTTGLLNDMVISQDEQYLLLMTKDGITLWNLAFMKFFRFFPIPDDIKPNRNVLGFTSLLSPDSEILLSTYEEHLLLWRVKSGQLLRVILADKSQLISLTITNDGKYAVTTSKNNNSIKVWKLSSFDEQTFEPLAMSSSCRYLDLSRDGELMVARSNQPYDVAVVSVQQGQIISRPSKDFDVLSPSMSPDGKSIVLREYTSEEAVKVWDAGTGSLTARIPVSSIQLKLVSISADGTKVATVSESEITAEVNAKVWSARDGKILHTLQLQRGFVNQMHFVLDDSSLVFSKQMADSQDVQLLEVAVYDCQSGNKVLSFPNVKRETLHIFHDDSTKVLVVRSTASSPGIQMEELVLLSLVTGEIIVTCPDTPVRRLSICGNGTRGIDAGKYIFDLVEGRRLFTFEEEVTKRFHNPQLSWEGTHAVWISLEPGIFKLGHVPSRQILAICPVHSILMALFITRNNTVAVGCEDGRLMLLQLCESSEDGIELFEQALERQRVILGKNPNKTVNPLVSQKTQSGFCYLV